jgi:hypothetical protein
VTWAPEAGRHGFTLAEALHAIANADAAADVAGLPKDKTMVFVGLPHAQALRPVEVIAARRPSGEFVIFHVMELSDIYRGLLGGTGDR